VRPLTAPSGDVTGAVLCVADVTEAARLRAELTHHATYDALTGCLNRASIMAAARNHETGGVAAILIDLNRFKEINDTLGHAAGDDLLIYVTSALGERAGQHRRGLGRGRPDRRRRADRRADEAMYQAKRQQTGPLGLVVSRPQAAA
jgi:hypothetical protein